MFVQQCGHSSGDPIDLNTFSETHTSLLAFCKALPPVNNPLLERRAELVDQGILLQAHLTPKFITTINSNLEFRIPRPPSPCLCLFPSPL